MKKRWLPAIVLPFFLLLVVFLYREGGLFPCYFYQLTGFYCVGCGGSRAVFALLHGNLALALHYNALIVLSLPFLGYFLLALFLKAIFVRDILPLPKLPAWGWLCLALASAVFTVVRNLPFLPPL